MQCALRLGQFESQDGDHVPDDETCLDRTLSLLRHPARCTNESSSFCTFGQNWDENADLTAYINRLVLLTNLRFRRQGLPLYDQLTAPFRRDLRMLKAKVIETILYGCVTWSPAVAHLAITRKPHHRLLLRCIGWKRKHSDGHHMLSYADALPKTRCENVGTTVRKGRMLFTGFEASLGVERGYPNERCLGNWRGERVTW